jgi:hypothetical protein
LGLEEVLGSRIHMVADSDWERRMV